MRYTFIGDVHGKIPELMQAMERRCGDSDRVLQLGDMGLGFKGVHLPTINRAFGFIRGNHDSPSICRSHPNYAGEWGMWHDIFVIGGAFSIDAAWRTPGISWWPDEELSEEELGKELVAYVIAEPEVVASHDCPRTIGEMLLKDGGLMPEKWGSTESHTAKHLQRMFNHHQPKHWLFGHYHRDWQATINGTQFNCLNELSIKHLTIGE